jgi:fatty-acyl-CoA synthase
MTGLVHGARQDLARYEAPREVVFLDELPRNATGKVLKRELKLIEV